jgi:hypothetical protein
VWTDQVADRGIVTTEPLSNAATPAATPVVPPASFGSPRDARAQAKAAKAYARAQRPWYRKKRWWALGAIALLIVIGVASGSSSTKNNTPTAATRTTTRAGSANGVQSVSDNHTHPPQADVRVSGCSYDSSTGFATATLTIVNHSSKRSDYLISVDFENSKGVQLGDNYAGGGDNVDPGQSSIVQAVDTLTATPDALKCVLKSVDRTESSG